ncbi:hypothetical protein DXG01_004050 [Tephrocybe rancida]|nr:hypothetical protein DXG01_004050 [Tephrocybe rancida]
MTTFPASQVIAEVAPVAVPTPAGLPVTPPTLVAAPTQVAAPTPFAVHNPIAAPTTTAVAAPLPVPAPLLVINSRRTTEAPGKDPEETSDAPAEKDDTTGEKGKTAPGQPDKEDMVIKGVHAFPCKLCKAHGWECQKRVGKDGKIGACAACYLAKGACTHSMKGKGKKVDDGASKAPKKTKPKRKAPKTPMYVSDKDDKATTPLHPPPPPPKRAHIIMPPDLIRVVSQEDVDAVCQRAQKARPHPAPLQAQVHLPSHCPPPEPHPLKRGDWFQEMVEYVDEVNARNMEHQQRITSAVSCFLGIVDALPIGAAAGEEVRALASWVSELKESTNIGFKHLK